MRSKIIDSLTMTNSYIEDALQLLAQTAPSYPPEWTTELAVVTALLLDSRTRLVNLPAKTLFKH